MGPIYKMDDTEANNFLKSILFFLWLLVQYRLNRIDLTPLNEIKKRFGAMYDAFGYGAPPHGGIAPGIDRIVMLIAGVENIREVIAFPMNQQAQDLLMDAPSTVNNNQLKELNSISDSTQNTKASSQNVSLSYKDMKLTDAINYIQNGESHQIWLSLASDGLDNAQYILGVLYIKGIGVSKSMKEAAYWINLARQNGSMDISYEADEVWNEFELWKYE